MIARKKGKSSKKVNKILERLRGIFFFVTISLFSGFFLVTLFNYFLGQSVIFPIIFFLLAFSFFLGWFESRKYKENNPYLRVKSRKKILIRVLTGFMAALHYVHAITTYNHKKYNTQVFHPETLECYVGLSWVLILVFYGLVAYWVSLTYDFLFLIALLIPVITNIAALFWTKRK